MPHLPKPERHKCESKALPKIWSITSKSYLKSWAERPSSILAVTCIVLCPPGSRQRQKISKLFQPRKVVHCFPGNQETQNLQYATKFCAVLTALHIWHTPRILKCCEGDRTRHSSQIYLTWRSTNSKYMQVISTVMKMLEVMRSETCNLLAVHVSCRFEESATLLSPLIGFRLNMGEVLLITNCGIPLEMSRHELQMCNI